MAEILDNNFEALNSILNTATRSDWSNVFDAIFYVDEYCNKSGSLYDSMPEGNFEELIDSLYIILDEARNKESTEKEIKRNKMVSDEDKELAYDFMICFWVDNGELNRVIYNLEKFL